jgi:hypothetical protein
MPRREPVAIEEPRAEENASPLSVTITPAVEEQAVIEAYLEQLAGENNIWEYLHRIRNVYNIPMEHRHQYYNQFIGMVAVREPADQDACLESGRAVFHYRMETARHDVAALRHTQGSTLRIAPTVIGDDFIAEIIHVPNEANSVKYLRYNADGTTEIDDRVQLGNILYTPPPVGELVESGALTLPTGVEEYGATLDLVRDLRGFLTSFVTLDRDFANLSAIYTPYTWIADRVSIAPYLQAIGDFGAGKTTWEAVMAKLVRRGFVVAGALTPAVIYRVLTMVPSTLVVDEADFDPRSETWSAIKTILNIGTTPRVPIIRNEGSENGRWAPRAFTSFGPKVLAMRRPFPDQALASRCITHTFRPRSLPAHIPLMLDHELDEGAAPLRNKLLLWRFRNFRSIVVNTRERLDGLEPRINAIALALLATCRGEEMTSLRQTLIEVAQRHSDALKESRAESFEGQVSTALIDAWRHNEKKAEILMKSVTDRVQQVHRDIEPERVSAVVRGPLGFKTRRRAGYSWVIAPESEVQALADRYGIRLPQPVPSGAACRASVPQETA